MVTVLCAEGLRVVIYANDHLPAHVFGDGEAKIDLAGDQDAPILIWADKMTRGKIRCAMRVVTEQLEFLRQRWEDLHE